VTKSPCLFPKNVVRMFGDCDSSTLIPISLRFAWTISPKRAKFGLFAGPTPWTVIGVWTPDFFSAALAFFTLYGYRLARSFWYWSTKFDGYDCVAISA